ncbi:hypothetical protein ACTHGU_14145 [Chitinophagaceae bacterium MMS25-I14]
MRLPADKVNAPSGFTVHYLQDTFKELPFTSVAFRLYWGIKQDGP